MVRIISICSGKGGVGKTTVAANLGLALTKIGKNVIVIDTNLTTSHLGLSLGIFHGRTINDYMRDMASLQDTVYTHQSGLRIIPASLELNDLSDLNTEKLRHDIKEKFQYHDYVILDSSPGIGKESLISLKTCDEAIFIATPYIQSLVDILKIKNLSRQIGFMNSGLVLNRVSKKKYELSSNEIMNFVEMPILGVIPEDKKILGCVNSRSVSLSSYPKTKSSRAFVSLAFKIAGSTPHRYYQQVGL